MTPLVGHLWLTGPDAEAVWTVTSWAVDGHAAEALRRLHALPADVEGARRLSWRDHACYSASHGPRS